MELNNNDENENLGRNPLINNNNNNENNNEINIEDDHNFLLQYSVFTYSFILIFLINLIILLTSFYHNYENYKYVFQIGPIFDHSQYYRFISRYFVHFGICHLFIELYITLYLCKNFENIFGTLMSISFILISLIIDSIIQICFYFLLSYTSNIFTDSDNSYLEYEGGLTPVLFTLNTFFNLFDQNNMNNEFNILLFTLGKGKYSSFYMLATLYFFTPNRTFFGNLCGILGAYLIKNSCLIFLPKVSWIIGFEKSFNLNKNGKLYRYVTNKNVFMRNILNQIESGSVREIYIEKEDINNSYQINNNGNNEVNQSAIEMSSLSNNNNNNNIQNN